jgi:hypothetical protein
VVCITAQAPAAGMLITGWKQHTHSTFMNMWSGAAAAQGFVWT